MALVVQKYGGTSVADVGKIRRVAAHVVDTKRNGNDVIAVVSAMSGETDRLVGLAREIMDPPDEREFDVVTSSGEQVSSGLLAMAIKSLGEDAASFQGHQIRITTDSIYSRARIKSIDDRNVRIALGEKKAAVVAGFQGADERGNLTTLGRGGSDLTAVAVAAVMSADACELYKDDVDGVYTADPGICPDARKLPRVSYEEMLEMASLGSKVLQARAVEFAKKFKVPIHVKSTRNPASEGTWVVEERKVVKSMEDIVVSGVTRDSDQAKITLTRVPDQPGIAATLFSSLAERSIVVDMIVQNVSKEGSTDLTFTVPEADFKRSLEISRKIAEDLGAKRVLSDSAISKVSLVGVGMKTHSGVASRMFTALAGKGINIMMISTSEIKISCVLEEKDAEEAVRTLHDAFGMGEAK